MGQHGQSGEVRVTIMPSIATTNFLAEQQSVPAEGMQSGSTAQVRTGQV